MNSQKEWQHTQDLQVQTGQNARPEKGKQTQVVCLTKELLIVDTFWEKEHPFSPLECHWMYELPSRADPMPKSSWQIQNQLHVFLSVLFVQLCYFVLFGFIGFLYFLFCCFLF